MKKAFLEKDFKKIEDAVYEMNRADARRAAEILKMTESYLAETNLDEHITEHISILIGTAHFYINGKDADKAYGIILRAEGLAKEKGSDYDKKFVQSNIAIVYSLRGEHLRAVDIWEALLQEITPEHKLWIAIANNLIVAYGFSNHYTKAVDMSYRLISHLETKGGKQEPTISAYINLGNSYLPLNSFDKALDAYFKAMELAEAAENINYQNYLCTNLAGVYTQMQDYPKALEYAERSLKLSKDCFGDIAESEALCLMGHVTLRMGRLDEAESYLLQALEKQRKISNPVGFCDTLISLGELYLAKDQPEKAFMYYQELRPLIEEMDVLLQWENYHRAMTRYYQKTNDYQMAHEHQAKLTEHYQKQYDALSENMISTREAEYLRKQIEDQNEELQASLDILNRLISVLSHDVRGPAASSAAALNLILEGHFEAKKTQTMIGHVVKNLEGVTDLLTEMMLWIESRAFRKDLEGLLLDVGVCELIESVLRYYEGQVGQKHITVNKSLQRLISYTEPNMLKIVLRNIISNAIKYTPPQGQIFIELFDNEEGPRLVIKDTGVGMHPEELAKLSSKNLEPKTGTAQELGMGMGLSMSLGYLKLLGIDYEVHSEIDKGSVFILKLQKAKNV